jgi:hypothetical protein
MTMRYVCLVWFDNAAFANVSEAEGIALTDQTIEFDRELQASGHLLVAQPLRGPETAVSIRVRQGQASRTDGPFAETKEWVGGLFMIEAADLDEAVAIVERDPIARYGRVEIRPTMDGQTHSQTGAARPAL